jgi:chemotaxis receptor (MCP) glutamine deamidase CheD
MAHITGGGLPENLPRCLPAGLQARIDPASWERPQLFRWLQEKGEVPEADLWHTFNLGVGYCLVLPEAAVGELDRTRFGVHAMETLINSMMHLGADPRRLEARLYGGANVITGMTTRPTVGERNAIFAKAFLERERIPLMASVLGGERGLEVRFESNTARVTTREIGREQVDTAKEKAASAASATIGGDVELFIDA